VKSLGRAVELDPDDAEARANLALAHFRTRRFEDAQREAESASEADPDLPDAYVVKALLAERRGRNDEADRHLARAEKLDPERFPRPVRLSRAEFEAEVIKAGAKLPPAFRQHLDSVALTVEDVPSHELLFDGEPPLDPELLGLFVGTPLTELAHFGAGVVLPPRILLFQRNLERHAQDTDDLRDEIAVTVYHELGHYLGLDEVELEEIDLA
jgi:predicted Zn-dependent protease with MMP-like domain